jgi:MraZ protein
VWVLVARVGRLVVKSGGKWLTWGRSGGKDGAQWGEVAHCHRIPHRTRQHRGRKEVAVFVGEHERQLDDKGRIAIPAEYRDRLGESCYLVKGADRCIDVVPVTTFEAEAERLIALEQAGQISRNHRRAMASSASLARIDKQGRVNIQPNLLGYADLSLEQRAMVVGNFDRLQIWWPERYHLIEQEGTGELAGRPMLIAEGGRGTSNLGEAAPRG